MALTDTRFSAGGTVVDFVHDAAGAVIGFTIYTVEGDQKATRK